MKRRSTRSLGRRLIILTVIFLIVTIGVIPVLGLTIIPSNSVVNLTVSNIAGARFNDNSDNTYNFFAAGQSETQGLNALHLSTSNAASNYGEVTFTSAQSGVFYMTDTGGRGWDDDGILMLAVNGTIPANFRVHIRASGYRWTPVLTGTYPTYNNISYVTGAVDEYFTIDDFTYGPQIWKPCPATNYPLHEGQDMNVITNTFSIMFIDLNAGILGSNTLSSPTYSGQTVTDNGSIRIEYSFENLQTFAALNAYAYTVSSNQGQGVRWTNRVGTTGSSGYNVLGQLPDAPVAVFSGTPLSGTAPLGVTFTDSSSGTSITNRRWDFGDGNISSYGAATNPYHRYTSAGTYTVNLTVTNAGGSNSQLRTNYVTVSAPPGAPTAAFTGTPVTGTAPLGVTFTDSSSGTSITNRRWDFGDGNISSYGAATNPYHRYTSAGTYTVNLTVTNAGGSNSQLRTNYVTVSAPPGAPVAAFTGTPLSGTNPLSVTFTDSSSGLSITSRRWDFGDGNISSYVAATNPYHRYTSAGTYTVNLTVTNAGGSNSQLRTNYVTVSAPPGAPVAAFTGTPLSGTNPLSVTFTDSSSGLSITSRRWDFGDGNITTYTVNTNPRQIYANPGLYSINLTVSNSSGSASFLRPDYITVTSAAPVINSTTQVGIFRASTGNWYTDTTKTGVVNKSFHFGTNGDSPVVGDWDGNGIADIGVFRPASGNWYLDTTKTGVVNKSFHFGTSGDSPVVGDWDGNGIADIGVFRPASGNWYLDTTKTGVVNKSFHFGTSGDSPVVGDWDGNGIADIGVFRPASGNWYLDTTKTGVVNKSFHFGTSGDSPVVGDWDGNGIADIGVFRPASGNWYLDTTKTGVVNKSFHFGTSGDSPVVGDWDGNGIADIGVFRPASGNWYLDTTKTGVVNKSFHFGTSGDTPLAGDWI